MRFVSRQRLRLHVNPTVVAIALVVTAVDALTKAWARSALATKDLHVIGAMWLRLQYNSGISFSLNRSGPLGTTIATVIISVVVVVIGVNASRGAPTVGFGLLLGGGVANVIDRLSASPHQVTDFIALGSFPVFNLADISISAGFVVLIVAALQGSKLLAL
ncbi:MAG: signal peptidase II [Acidimicrobiaceae bacterium]|nr:signal peptidase II [Acidimicrobiaceae bacterium]